MNITPMKSVNTFVLNFTISIIDYLYRGRHFQRFWVLEEIARAPYFAFLSVLHFRESLGLRGPEHLHLMKEHFEQTVNETEHLEWWSLLVVQSTGLTDSCSSSGWLFIIGSMSFIIWRSQILSPVLWDRDARSINLFILYEDYNDKDIAIMNDEVQHFQELHKEAMEMIKWRLGIIGLGRMGREECPTFPVPRSWVWGYRRNLKKAVRSIWEALSSLTVRYDLKTKCFSQLSIEKDPPSLWWSLQEQRKHSMKALQLGKEGDIIIGS